jgi:ribosomal protein S18 acetylase RimI-like enzyme
MWERRHGTGGSEHPGGMASPLDNPVWASLTGPHARFAERRGRVVRYAEDVAPFLGLPDDPGAQDWLDVAELGGPGAVVVLASTTARPPAGWEVLDELPGVQLVDESVAAAPDPEAVRLGLADVPEMLDLVERTKPGPFRKRTVELGTYLGIRRDGALVAMAGERLHPPGHTEISAVCTDPAYRGQGLATRLVLAVAAGIRERGETPMMHAAASNTSAIRLYLSLGFVLRQRPDFVAVRVPG